MTFKSRLSEPDSKNKYWIRTSQGGYNSCINISNGSVLPNCVGYAYGRFMEIMNVTSCKLSTRNAGLWYGNTADGYERGKTPKLGAVICWHRPGQAGHVAIVERINDDGSIVTSNSAYGGRRFYTQTLNPPNYTWSSNYILQGFIYNPCIDTTPSIDVSKLSKFLHIAKSHINDNSQWIRNELAVCTTDWGLPYILACAKQSDILDVLIPKHYDISTLISTGVMGECGTFYESKYIKNSFEPKPGDLILFRWENSHKTKYGADSIGIVVDYSDDAIRCIVGNVSTSDVNSSIVKLYHCDKAWESIFGYYRPNWDIVGASYNDLIQNTQSIFSSSTTRRDSLIREVGYIDSNYNITTRKSDIELSVINYTDLLSNIFTSIYTTSESDIIVGGIDNEVGRSIAEFFVNLGWNASMIAGLLGNIYQECRFNPSAVNSIGASGLCQWLGDRKSNMISMVGNNWKNNVSGQCEFIWSELNSTEHSTLSALQNEVTSNSESMACKAAEIICRKYERPGSYDKEVPLRQKYAKKYYSQLVIQQVSGSLFDNTSISINSLPTKSSVEIPSWVNQSGIVPNYTNYSYWYSRWSKSSIQYKLSRIWDEQGRPQHRNIATIDKYYLCAVTTKFGTTGDIITVVLEDNVQFSAIIADSKGVNPALSGESGSVYGHSFGSGKIDIIEWEKVGSSISASDNTTEIDLSGWKGKKVTKILNHGSYF